MGGRGTGRLSHASYGIRSLAAMLPDSSAPRCTRLRPGQLGRAFRAVEGDEGELYSRLEWVRATARFDC
jgi:hypothetical protein